MIGRIIAAAVTLAVCASANGGLGHRVQSGQRGRKHPDQTCDRTLGCSPIVINFTGAYALSGADDPVLFDIDADGVKNRIGWTARGSDEAFLALDGNANGRIDDGRELFGNAVAANGFEALRELDDNGDGAIDARDRVWPRLLLWRDADHDALSTSAELTGVAATAIQSFDLGYAWTGRVDRHGNELRYAAGLSASLRTRSAGSRARAGALRSARGRAAL